MVHIKTMQQNAFHLISGLFSSQMRDFFVTELKQNSLVSEFTRVPWKTEKQSDYY